MIVSAALALAPSVARAQACCSGSGAITPARLALHEDALAGVGLRAAGALGSYDTQGRYVASPSGTSELDLEQDLLGALRVLGRGQVALLVPLVETRRTVPGTSEFGGGFGDVNVGARYDFLLAGESRFVPGVALLVGVTLPTGRPVESSTKPLATDATGIGAFQGNVGLALEQTFGPWLVNATAIVAKRAARSVLGVDETLGTQLTALGAVAYSFPNDAALAIVGSYMLEGDATINGASAPDSGKRLLTLSVAGLLPLYGIGLDAWRLQGSVFLNPPASSLGKNQLSTTGLTLSVLRTWS